MGLDDVAIGVCLAGCVWFAGKPKVRRWVFVRLVGTPIRALGFCQGTAGLLIRRSAPSGAVAGRFMELRGAYSRSGGGMKRVLPAKVEEGLQCAGGWLLGLVLRGMRGQCGPASVGPRARLVVQTERSGEQRL